MPWVIKQEGERFCVYKQVNGEPSGKARGCHPTRKEARKQQEALYAVESAPVGARLVDLGALVAAGAETLVSFTAAVVPIGSPSNGDRRIVDSGVSFRPFPQPLWSQLSNSGHEAAALVGRVDRMWVDGSMVMATGVIDTALDYADQTLAALRLGALKSVSFDPAGGSAETEILAADANTGETLDWLTHYQDLVIGGITVVGIPAWQDTWIRLDESADAAPQRPVLTAAADLSEMERPPLGFFEDPCLPGRTRTTVSEPDENGHRRVYGHLAPWGECHIGIQGRCQEPPRSASGYGWYLLGTMSCAEGCKIPIGTIVMDSGHAPKTASIQAARAYYDQTGWAVADITTGEDDHGIWFSGAMRRGLSTDDVRAFEAARLSGDWRPTNNALELVAVAAVNVGGFPIYEKAVAADGSVQSLVWAPEFEPEPPELAPHAWGQHLVGLLTERVFQL